MLADPVALAPLCAIFTATMPLPSVKWSQVQVPTQSPVTLTVGLWVGVVAQLAVASATSPIVNPVNVFMRFPPVVDAFMCFPPVSVFTSNRHHPLTPSALSQET